MKLIPLFFEGSLATPLTYNFGSLYPITQGEWELTVKTIGLHYKKSTRPGVPDPPNINRFVRISCNYVQCLSYDRTKSQILTEESVLALNRLKLKAGQKEIFHFSYSDFFLISHPTQKFQINLCNSDGTILSPEISAFLNASVLIYFRRRG